MYTNKLFTEITVGTALAKYDGEHITVNGASFTCHGTTDEQASTLFVPRYYRWVVITGDENFTPDQIQQIEGLRITPSFHHVFY